jgi:uncharacterized protein (DUF1697 family)
MNSYISLLRGINLGAHKQIKMPTLKALYESLNLKAIQTYIQSGNVVFESDASAAELAPMIQKAIEAEYGFLAETLVFSREEWQAIIAANPFPEVDTKMLYVTLLETVPKPEAIEAIGDIKADSDEYRILGRVIYLYCPNGYGRTKLNNNFWERKLKVVATTRNWNSMIKLLDLASD